MRNDAVLSRHRLPQPYRLGLTVLWAAPAGLLLTTLTWRWGFTPVLLDPRLLLIMLLMLIPAFYIWQEGLDVLPGGIVRRVHVPRFYAYHHLETWYLDRHPDHHTLTIWDAANRKVIECRGGHLTHLPQLLAALKCNLRYRHWPH